MSACVTCGANPCVNPAFCLAAREDDAKRGAKPNGNGQDSRRRLAARLLDDVHSFLGRFVAYPSQHAHVAHVFWIAHTHLMDAWESTPRLAFLSPEPELGKTRAI